VQEHEPREPSVEEKDAPDGNVIEEIGEQGPFATRITIEPHSERDAGKDIEDRDGSDHRPKRTLGSPKASATRPVEA
jgi:hypothetical protein